MTTKSLIEVLRASAKLLLVVVPAVLVTGFLTAKPFLFGGVDFTVLRRLHTVVAPLIFLPLFYLHSLAGIRYLLSRSKRLDTRAIRVAATLLWTALVVGVAALYLASPPPSVDDTSASLVAPDAGQGPVVPLGQGDGGAVVADAGRDTPRDGAPPEADLASRRSHDATAGDLRPPRSPPAAAKRPPRRGARAPSKSPAGEPAPAPIAAKAPTETTDVKAPAPETPQASSAPSGAKLVPARCVGCHPLSTVYAKRRSAAEWRSILARMIAMGAKLSTQERQAVVTYLSNR